MTKKAWQGTKLDKDVIIRFKKLGELGEYLATKVLLNAGFINIVNLNKTGKQNTKFFDLIAERCKQKYAISVKARNKYENSIAGKRLNSRYKLTDSPNIFEQEAKEKYSCLPAWIAISLDFDEGVFDAYFGETASLGGNKKGIIMNPKATENYEILARSQKLCQMGITDSEMQSLKNLYQRL